jgi:hypothetical protein
MMTQREKRYQEWLEQQLEEARRVIAEFRELEQKLTHLLTKKFDPAPRRRGVF